MFDIAKVTPSLFSNSIVGDVQNPKTPAIYLVQINKRIIDHQKN